MALALYGIPNCDTVKRARAWLAERGVAVDFHDFKRAGLEAQRLARWTDALGWERLLNRRGTSWRGLPEAERATVTDAASAQALMLRQFSLIKRPVVEWPDGALSVGFEPEDWSRRVA
jgi:Spx/MgsR family transcriptional regulator